MLRLRWTGTLLLFLLISSSFAYLPNGFAAMPIQKKAVPTTIQADRMTHSAEHKTTIFTGHVHVSRPDFQLWAKKMTVYFKDPQINQPSAQSNSTLSSMTAGELYKIVAEQDVVLKSEGKEGRCKLATYYAEDSLFVMEGSPVLKDKENIIKGDTIRHHMKTNYNEVVGNVHANFVTPEKNEPSKK